MQHSNDWRKWVLDNKILVVQSFEHQKKYLGFKRMLKAFNISSNQFYLWRNESECKTSVFKRFPNPLSLKSVQPIKQYLANEQFKHWLLASVYYQMVRDGASMMGLTTFHRCPHPIQTV